MVYAYALLSLLSAIIASILILLVFREGLSSKSNQITIALFFLLFLWSVFDIIQRSTESEYLAFISMSALLSVVIFIPPVIFHFSYVFPWKKRSMHPFIIFIYGISFVLLALHLNSNAFISRVEHYSAGYDLIPGPYTPHLLIYASVMVVAALFVLLIRYTHMQGDNVLMRMRYIIAGFSVIIFLTIATAVVPILYGDYSRYPLTAWAFSIGGIIMIYGFISPMPELPAAKQLSEGQGVHISGIKVFNRDKSYQTFYRLVTSGMAGVCVSGRKEEDVREELGLRDIPVVSAEKLLKDMKRDEAVDTLFFMICDSAMDRGTVVFLDSLDRFVGPSGTRKLIEDLKRMKLKGAIIFSKD